MLGTKQPQISVAYQKKKLSIYSSYYISNADQQGGSLSSLRCSRQMEATS